ncbi:putative regulator of Ras-like GTPase activity (Roadblock/LC7/MglB family) [Methanomicrobium sp. W14]|uniref:roadblock/LC7 domain-containing protein n=1 Tax=Methanomicrobium sp. W14 TaxID=2817839 RepID=UPI001AEA8F72|nr:roadblock/LC7 domain-containing protein [Methanomicrobium sp. W14]MBP2134491.1 putative regulator of Ras-like GTPase activity (Roadblock/LC7/MglB family) [Methanomicrobium sp. W14]
MSSGLPEGEKIAAVQISPDRLSGFITNFSGCVRTERDDRKGFLLVEKGKPVAAAYTSGGRDFSGNSAYEMILDEVLLDCILNAYTEEELETAKSGLKSDFLVSEEEMTPGKKGDILSPDTLSSVMRQPGVIAVSVIFEGFALQSLGDADFEHVAAVTEDLVRAGSKITGDLMMGSLNQLLLETPNGKLIVAPVNELYICVLAEKNANLGLIRLALQSVRYDNSED